MIGKLWGVKRLAESRPELLKPQKNLLTSYLQSPDAEVRDLAAQVIEILKKS
ncbi:MAG: hypothetical protein ACYS8W_07185 [Planctomycetota bacterium]|jgi:hypothetical protein